MALVKRLQSMAGMHPDQSPQSMAGMLCAAKCAVWSVFTATSCRRWAAYAVQLNRQRSSPDFTDQRWASHLVFEYPAFEQSWAHSRHLSGPEVAFDERRFFAHRDQQAVVRFILACLRMNEAEHDDDL